LAYTLVVERSYPEGIRAWEHVLSLAPDLADGYANKAEALLLWRGDTLGARNVVRQAIGRVGLARVVSALFVVSTGFEFVLLLPDIAAADLGRLSLADFQSDTTNYLWYKAELYGALHRPLLARVYADSARAYLEQKVRDRPQDGYWHQALGFIYAMLGRKAEAIREDRKGVELAPVADVWGRWMLVSVASADILTLAGEADGAIDQLEHLLAHPARISRPLLRIDPFWGPLRGNPRFERLVAGG
jgi:tetratricopeptide (TPR) repeat protein